MNWLPENPYPEKVSDDISSTMVPSDKYRLWQEGAMVAAGNIFTKGSDSCPHAEAHSIHMKRRECATCWNNLLKEIGIERK